MHLIETSGNAIDTSLLRGRRGWDILLLAGICLRVALSAISLGSDDAVIWQRFAEHISTHGLFDLYRTNQEFNHPPIPGYWAMLAYNFTRHHRAQFGFVFRVPGILADVLSCFLLLKIGNRRALRTNQQGLGPKMALVFAWSPCAILMSGFHGSTDSVYAALCLLAAYCATELASPFAAGLALGAAINVKLIPVMLIVPFLLLFRSPIAAGKFIAGLVLMVVPFIPVLIESGSAFHHNAMEYNSAIDYWGVDQILLEAQTVDKYAGWGVVLLAEYHDVGRYLIFASILTFALIARRKQLDFYTTGAGAAALFLIFTPGFGVQYLVFVLPLLIAADLKRGLIYGLLAGAFMFIAYDLFWDGSIPIQTLGIAGRVRRGPGDLLALLTWAQLIVFVFRAVSRPTPAPLPAAT